jgi:chemotaxis protein methyltransferase WspC
MEKAAEQIGSLLRRRIGLNPATLGPHGLIAAVRTRMNACKMVKANLYVRHLESTETEVQALIEEVAVLESWFFRDVRPFECLRWFVREVRLSRPLRVLSVPCGPGEEVYSLALTLFDLGLSAEEFSVAGVDLTQRGVACGREGAYGPRSFRETASWIEPLCRRYLKPDAGGFRAGPELRRVVRFSQGNLVDPFFLMGQSEGFEVIFCRNLLIYLAEEARQTALTNLHRLLAPGGMLYVGHAEARVNLDRRFTLLNPNYPFAHGLAPVVLPPSTQDVVLPPLLPVLGKPAERVKGTPVFAPPPEKIRGIAEAQEAANEGRLNDAVELCQQLNQDGLPSPAVLCLLGVIRQAQGDRVAAARFFHQAVYLDPAHQESLVHLALLAEADGDSTRAALYRRRAARARSGE